MRLLGVFEYCNEKGSVVTDYFLCSIFILLRSLAPSFPKSIMDCEDVSDRKVELVCNDAPYYVLVLAKLEMA